MVAFAKAEKVREGGSPAVGAALEGQAGGPGGNARKPPGTQVCGSAQTPAARRNPRAYSEQEAAATTSVSP